MNQFTDFESPSDDIFDRLQELELGAADNRDRTICPECDLPMRQCADKYICKQCGQSEEWSVDANQSNTTTSNIKITTGTAKLFYGINCDYSRTQRKCVIDQLKTNAHEYRGTPFPLNVLNNVATIYNEIQKLDLNFDDLGGITRKPSVNNEKKFVKRGNIKNQVLAALIYFECVREKIIRKRRDIADFMKLPSHGFSRGEGIIRRLQSKGHVALVMDDDDPEGFVDRWLERLNVDIAEHRQFIIDIVNESETKKIGMTSQISSKVVGAMWVLISKKKIKINATELERATDNTKKNTFSKFSAAIYDNMEVFGPIFVMHEIPV